MSDAGRPSAAPTGPATGLPAHAPGTLTRNRVAPGGRVVEARDADPDVSTPGHRERPLGPHRASRPTTASGPSGAGVGPWPVASVRQSSPSCSTSAHLMFVPPRSRPRWRATASRRLAGRAADSRREPQPTIARQYRQSMVAGRVLASVDDGRAGRPADPDPGRLRRLGGDDLHGQLGAVDRLLGRGGPRRRRHLDRAAGDGARRHRRHRRPRARLAGPRAPARRPPRAGCRGRAASWRCSRATTRCRCSAGWRGDRLFRALMHVRRPATFASAGMAAGEWTGESAVRAPRASRRARARLRPALWSFAPYARWRDVCSSTAGRSRTSRWTRGAGARSGSGSAARSSSRRCRFRRPTRWAAVSRGRDRAGRVRAHPGEAADDVPRRPRPQRRHVAAGASSRSPRSRRTATWGGDVLTAPAEPRLIEDDPITADDIRASTGPARGRGRVDGGRGHGPPAPLIRAAPQARPAATSSSRVRPASRIRSSWSSNQAPW